MDVQAHGKLFNRIAWVYQYFFRRQIKSYTELIKENLSILDLDNTDKILDFGCGTGAFSAAFQTFGFEVEGVDIAEKMVEKGKANNVNCFLSNIIDGIDRSAKYYDLVTAAFLMHGLESKSRLIIYREMARVSKNKVLIHDYNQKRSWFVSMIEWIEHGDYFDFIKDPISEMKKVFSNVQEILVGNQYSWYLCEI